MRAPIMAGTGGTDVHRHAGAATRPGPVPRATALALLLLCGALLGVVASLVIPRMLGDVGSADDATPPAVATAPAATPEDPSASPGPKPGSSLPSGAPPHDGYADIIRPVMPAVVNISSVQVIQTYERISPFFSDPFFRQFFGDRSYDFVVPRERRSLSLGSGVVIDARGTILTNNHVVEGASEINVSFSDGREVRARIVGTDPRTDLAVLRVDGGALPYAVMGDSNSLEVGDVVLAIGSPFGLGQTVTMGIVSAIGRGNIGIVDYEDFIQTDAAINPGNSGGALVNTRGELVGINTAILSRSGGYQGIGFAIPSDMVREVLEDILEHGRVIRGYAGLALQGITPDLARAFSLPDTHGALVARLDPDGPAAASGLRRGDVILSLQGRDVGSVDELRTRLSRFEPGDTVTLHLLRKGRRYETEMTLGEPPAIRARPGRRN